MTRFTGHRLASVRGERLVFAGLHFAVEAGEALVLTGPNGSGKSTLLRLMAGLGRPFAGHLRWDDEEIGDDPEAHRARLHAVGHLDAVKPVLTVAEQVSIWARLRGASADDARGRTTDALSRLGIDHLARLPGRVLSAGQRRRVNLARLLVAPAALWLLDEPRTALDGDAVARLDAAVADHRANGGMVVLSLHGGDRPPGATSLDLADFAPPDPDRDAETNADEAQAC